VRSSLKRIDKFGHRVRNRIYDEFSRYGSILFYAGYKEHPKKANLFLMMVEDITLYVDLREFDIPKIYSLTFSKAPKWKRNRFTREEWNRLNVKGCPVEISGGSYPNDDYILLKEEDQIENYEEDGFCKGCLKDFKEDGYFCSDECRNKALKMYLARLINKAPICEHCKKRILDPEEGKRVKELLNEDVAIIAHQHHVSYKDNRTVTLCASCHSKTHHSNDSSFEELKPDSKRPQKEPYYCKCEICGRNAKIRKDVKKQLCRECRKIKKCRYCGNITKSSKGVCEICQREQHNDKPSTRRRKRFDSTWLSQLK